jgi:hypothetical protein
VFCNLKYLPIWEIKNLSSKNHEKILLKLTRILFSGSGTMNVQKTYTQLNKFKV